jgi:large subunit ribosomal protein L17
MRHRAAGRYLNADTQHRLAMRRNLARSLFLHDRIVTTTAKAKAVRPFVEKLVTRARRALAEKQAGRKGGWLHEVRLLARDIPDRVALRRLLAEVAPRANRPGGYTRMVRDWKNQVGDNAPRMIFELVDRPAEAAEAGPVEEKAGKGKASAGRGKKGKEPAAKKAKTRETAAAGAGEE